MAIKDITTRPWILALFIRDDGERFLLGDGKFDFSDNLQHFSPNSFANDAMEVQGNDGVLLAGQVRRSASQVFEGVVGDGTMTQDEIETARREFFAFFRKNYYYKVVYVFADGSAIQRRQGFITDAPSVPEMWQVHPTYHVAVMFEDVNYYSYDEDANGDEIFGKSATIALATPVSGGVIWDADGAVWDSDGLTWEAGGGGAVELTVDTLDPVMPVWEVPGPAYNPTLTNLTTGEAIIYSGNVLAGQKLIVSLQDDLATLDGTNVLQNVSGSAITLKDGKNAIIYAADNDTAPASTLKWSEVLG